MDRAPREPRTPRRMFSIIATIGLLAGMLAIVASPVGAKVTGPNGRIVYQASDPATDSRHLFTSNADGSDVRQLLSHQAECPTWSPDGSKILLIDDESPSPLRPYTINPDGTHLVRLGAWKDRKLNLGCGIWSPDGARVALEGFNETDPQALGIYTVRASDGGNLVRITDNPFDMFDFPGDYSPDGSRIVFLRTNSKPQTPGEESGALVVMNADGTNLRRITSWGYSGSGGSWSPDGQWIVFNNINGNLFVIHPDGTGMAQIPIVTGLGRSFAPHPGWSPDGTRIVFTMLSQKTGYQHDIFTVRPDGTGLTQVTNNLAAEEFVDWGPHVG